MPSYSIGLRSVKYLISPTNHPPDIPDFKIKQVIRTFFMWYLRNKYLIHMLTKGKMYQQDLYIQIKNQLLYL